MIDILMATFQGDKYLAKQIESIINQTYTDWILIIRDDGSTDNSISIIKQYVQKQFGKIFLVQDNESCHSAKANFFQLLKYAEHDYVMFCDQDDVWKPDKLAIMVENMQSYEEANGVKCPILLSSQIEVVDINLLPIKKDSIFVDKRRLVLNKLLVDNEMPGCTMMFNKALYSKIIINDINKIIMHDWWIALYASVFGKIYLVDKAFVMYRQHENNESGAVNKRTAHYLLQRLNDPAIKKANIKLFEQAEEFQRCYGAFEPKAQKTIIDDYVGLKQKNKFLKILISIKKGYLKSGLFRTFGQLLYI